MIQLLDMAMQVEPSNQGKLIGLSIIFFFGILLCGWWWFFSGDVETVLSVDEVRGGWSLSPRADKIIFRSGEDYVLMFLATKQRYRFKENKCAGYIWLDNKILRCPNLIIDTDDLSETAYRVINASETDWNVVLTDAGTIYTRKNEANGTNFIFVLAHDYKHNPDKNYWITNVKNVDKVLQGHTYMSVPFRDKNPHSGKIYSPNRAYYYQFAGTKIIIYEAMSDKKLSETSTDNRLYQIGGWAADNSGIYFQLIPNGFLGDTSPLYKLKVP